MLPDWETRNPILANLLNPAFCGEILRRAIKGYNNESGKEMSFALCFTVLPVILHQKTLELLPKTTVKKFFEWIDSLPKLKISIAQRIKDMVPFTRESIQFLIYYNSVKISDTGNLYITPYKKKNIDHVAWDSVVRLFERAEFYGRWLAKSGTPDTIFAIIGIMP